jgi:hypothetical protein
MDCVELYSPVSAQMARRTGNRFPISAVTAFDAAARRLLSAIRALGVVDHAALAHPDRTAREKPANLRAQKLRALGEQAAQALAGIFYADRQAMEGFGHAARPGVFARPTQSGLS